MTIKILSVGKILFEGEVDSFLVPGVLGEFHVMENHAPVVSYLKSGQIKLLKQNSSKAHLPRKEEDSEDFCSYPIKRGVLEFSDNNGVVLLG